MQAKAYRVQLPARRAGGLVFASPHSGREYPGEMLARSELTALEIRSSEDAFVDELYADAPDLGAPLIAARVPRAFVDFNRAETELDPALIRGARNLPHNPRVACGLGVIPRVVAHSREIYRGKLPMAEARRRIELYWRPYHAQLDALLTEARRDFGRAILVDCHSMPHDAVVGQCASNEIAPEIVLGDRFGASAHREIVREFEIAFRAEGFRVSRNAPFAGAYISQAYGRPSRGQHAVQIEVDRSVYMHEATLRKRAEFDEVRAAIARVMKRVMWMGEAQHGLAAE